MMREYFEAQALIANGELKPDDLAGFRRAMREFPDGRYTIKVEIQRRKRTNAMNNFWWGVVVKLFGEHCGHWPDEMHEILKLKLLPKEVEVTNPGTGEVTTMTIGRSTANLSTVEFKDLIMRAQQLGAEMGIDIPDPGEQERGAA
jgi:hypothetical protein